VAVILKENSAEPHEKRNYLILALLALVILTFAPAMSAEYVLFDEHVLILENADVLAPLTFKSLVKIFTSFEPNIYTPLSIASHWLEYNLFGFNSAISHFINLLLHLICTVLVFQIVTTLVSDMKVAFVIAAIWAVHPVQVESVTWVMERRNLLFGLFYFASIMAYLKYQQSLRGSDMAAAIIFMVVSSLAKGLACFLPLVWLMLDWLKERPLQRPVFSEKLPAFIVAMAFLLTMLFGIQGGITKTEGRSLNFLLASYNIAFYVGKSILPTGLSPMYEINAASQAKLGSGPVYLLITLVAGLLICRRNRLAIFAALFYLLNIIPMSGIVLVGYNFYAGLHFLYVALLGILLCLIVPLHNAMSSRNLAYLLQPASIVVIICLSAISFQYTQLWGHSRTLLEHAVELDPANRFARNLLGLYYLEQENYVEAGKHYQELIRLYPEFQGGYYGMGRISRNFGRLREAISYFSKALEYTKKRADLPLDRGFLLMVTGDFAAAERDFTMSIENKYRDLALVHFWRSAARRRQGNYSGAIEDLQFADAKNSGDFSLKIGLAELYFEAGQISETMLALNDAFYLFAARPEERNEYLEIISSPSFATVIRRSLPYRNFFLRNFKWYPL